MWLHESSCFLTSLFNFDKSPYKVKQWQALPFKTHGFTSHLTETMELHFIFVTSVRKTAVKAFGVKGEACSQNAFLTSHSAANSRVWFYIFWSEEWWFGKIELCWEYVVKATFMVERTLRTHLWYQCVEVKPCMQLSGKCTHCCFFKPGFWPTRLKEKAHIVTLLNRRDRKISA